MNFKKHLFLFAGILSCSFIMAQQPSDILSVSASTKLEKSSLAFDKDTKTMWEVNGQDLKADQWLMFTIQTPGDVCELNLQMQGVSKEELKQLMSVFVTYDPMNLGVPVDYQVKGSAKEMQVTFSPKYGAHVRLAFKGDSRVKPFSVKEVAVLLADKVLKDRKGEKTSLRYMDPTLPVEERVESLLSVMTPEDKMELIREGWGIPGIPHLYVPPITKVEAVHGFSYGSGATIFPQALAMGATWNKKLTEDVAMAVGDETLAAGTMQGLRYSMWHRMHVGDVVRRHLVKTLCWYHKLVEPGLKDINLKACLLLRNILVGMAPPWADVIPMISVCPNVKCVRCFWVRSVM